MIFDYWHIINIGGIIATIGVLGLAAVFTIRSNVAQTWRNNYEAKEQECKDLHSEKEGWLIAKGELELRIQELQSATDLTSLRQESHAFHQELVTALTQIAATTTDHHEAQLKAIAEAQTERHSENQRMIAGIQAQIHELTMKLQELVEVLRNSLGDAAVRGVISPLRHLPPDSEPEA